METWIKIIAVVVIIIAIVYSVGKAREADEWRQQYETYRDSVEVILDLSEDLKKERDRWMDSASVAEDSVAELKDELQIVHGNLNVLEDQIRNVSSANNKAYAEVVGGRTEEEVLATAPVGAEPWIKLTFSLRYENVLLEEKNSWLSREIQINRQIDQQRLLQIGSLERALMTETQRADELEAIVMMLPDAPPQEKFLFIPLPSRTASFWIGAGVGLVTTVGIVALTR